MKPLNKSIFRAYDIRGIVDMDFDEEWVERLGRAAGTFFLRKGWDRAVVAHDCRHTSPAYMAAIASGLSACGLSVLSIGFASTPMFYYAATALNIPSGIIVTASHNPPEYNGFKVWGGETTLFGDDIQQIYNIMKSGDFAEPDETGPGIISTHDIAERYLVDLNNRARLNRPVKVVVDGGNGSGGEITVELLRRAGAEVTALYCEPDGDFPNHHPDPTIPEYLADLSRAVVEHGAEFGIGLDGDCDRLGIVDETGHLLYGDQLTTIFARAVLDEHPGATIIGDVKCSHLLFRDIEDRGGKAIMAPTGHSIMKARMKTEQADLGGEMSGHIFIGQRFFGYDDASYAALRFCEIVSRKPDMPVSTYLMDWPTTYNTPEIRMECPEHVKFPVVERAVQHFSRMYEITDMDGVRITFPDGWALVRASNTQNVLVMRFEAQSEERLFEIRELVERPLFAWIDEMA